MFYLIRAPRILQLYYNECLWKVKTTEKKIYLTFDDGPVPGPTDFVLDTLAQYNAKATFFCIGQRVEQQPELYQQLIDAGHAVGNHSYTHLNGWKTNSKKYLSDIRKASEVIDSKLFRPPYGRISKFQLHNLIGGKGFGFKPVMWHVLSADFDERIDPGQCYLNVVRNAGKGSIVVFHDSQKAFPNLRGALPRVLDYYSKRDFVFDLLDETVF